ncbi:MAG: prefoldin subunit alpha [Nanoarchaeota archaeon]|nr:prefoldin subunit alpha [Nanoarchaeota archaeon]MBU1320917.1 prefoldin subunit alpha [Nanoarchaeota archaeon]MBU1597558.1 prefoldin subunit alpha [Nanoarchaeota archaeon]MBU2441939.1 prefoldin subunit alpha [Nanoarchaeota archaeon]
MVKKKNIAEKVEKEDKQTEQNKYVQLQMLDQQAKQLQQYLQAFDQQLIEIRNVILSLKDLEKLKKGDSILAPMTNGIFVKAKLEDNKEVRVNVGSNTVVTKTIPETIKMLEGQEAEINQYRSDTLAKLDELIKKAEELQD